ncbi:hypothetical protein POTOM_005346 [Populus tomentosa]|uniref:Uncharacterized protein n=1 Tax=Populus tomentosa TaxID=118781 RepID=A0A8X8ALC0_POPTO|nr:hypothetical protein POTOM_005346 [Populus tomentosa]
MIPLFDFEFHLKVALESFLLDCVLSIIEMAFCNKFGSLVRQSIYQNGQVPVGPMLNSIRCMPSTNLFIRGSD